MTNTTTLKKADPKELQFLIDCEVAVYKLTVEGRNPANGDCEEFGAVVPFFFEAKGIQNTIFSQFTDKLAEGYTLNDVYQASLVVDPFKTLSATIYLNKPEALQAEDIKNISNQIKAKYHAEIHDHNEKVMAEQAAAEKLALDKEVNRRLAIKQEEERQAMLAVVMAELSAEVKPVKKAAK